MIHHLQLYKPVLQVLFAQIMDHAVDQVLFAAPTGWRPGQALQADHSTTRGPEGCGTGCSAGQRYRQPTTSRRAGAGAAGWRGPGPRDPDQLKEREADVRQGKAHQTHPQGVFVD